MTVPLFPPGESPGTDFVGLLRKLGHDPMPQFADHAGSAPETPHGTTVVALRYSEGVVMAGDRRATQANTIANRKMDKVFPVDKFSAVSIAGAAGPAQEMVRLFQTNVDFYEKIQGRALSLEGKANQLAQMVRGNMGAGMQYGLWVVPIFAGYDPRRGVGRIFTYDMTGSRTEETDFDTSGSGGRDARTTIKLGWREAMDRDDAVELAIQSLYEAADEDTATGGPDVVRGIYPMVALITAEGYQTVDEAEVAARFRAIIERKSAEGHRP